MSEKKKILIIENEMIIARIHQMLLIREGLEVRVSRGKENNLEVFNEYQPDAVLVDMHLKGPESAIHIARTIRRNSRIPIIFTGGVPERNEIVNETAAIDGSYTFPKPVDYSRILEILNSRESISRVKE